VRQVRRLILALGSVGALLTRFGAALRFARFGAALRFSATFSLRFARFGFALVTRFLTCLRTGLRLDFARFAM
jgi:hypothetical protein